MNKIEIEERYMKEFLQKNKIGVVDVLQLLKINSPKLWAKLMNRGLNDLSIQINGKNITNVLSAIKFDEDTIVCIDEYVFEFEIVEKDTREKIPKDLSNKIGPQAINL